jgi:hypothetical protein
MPRQPNAVDFWRGFALVTIFINHIPGFFYAKFTFSSYSVADSADLFVFLAGWSLRYVMGRGERTTPIRDVVARLGGRAVELYAAQVMITMIAIAILATTATVLDNPLLLEWNNAAAVFHDPVPAHIGLAILSHQMGYFDILPLYVVMMLMAPVFALIDRAAPALVLPVSLTIYLIVLAFQITLPTWPVPGNWFFNPLAWQTVFVLGFVLAKDDAGPGAFARRHIFWLRIAAAPIVVAGVVGVSFDLLWDPTTVPEPELFFLLDKTWATPPRLIYFLSMVAVFSMTFPNIKRAGEWPILRYPVTALIGMLAMMGRNSLYVFCIGSLLSLSGQVVRFIYRGTVGIDTAVVILGIAIMAVTAWLAEIRQRNAPARAR